MEHFAGLDVSVKETSICIVDDTGKIVREVKVASGSYHAGAFGEVVLAQGLGHEDRQAPRDEEGDRGAGAPVGGDHAPHLG
jgi:hypothetical protein